ncbi:hypothetical protein GCM10023116_33480 [Kistimonas scapharcae]|uniref:Uncharacterized protein n=1 Tax=Kistimonas scapharcae TaxID=1036133 RepID=A0ABP8V7Q1_9GAMM
MKTRLSRPLCTNLVLTQLGLGVTVFLGGGERRSEQLLETGTFFLGMWSGLLADALLTGGECTEVTRFSVYITVGIFLWGLPSLLASNVLVLDSDALSTAQVLPVFGLMMGMICALLERRLG